jgi:beta-xylosidase
MFKMPELPVHLTQVFVDARIVMRPGVAATRARIWLAVSALCVSFVSTAPGQAQSQKNSATLQDILATQSSAGRWGDQHNGTFLNPVLPGDFSDLDAIRVGDDFYAISSTMQYSPGMAVLHSRDLVDWQIVGHVVSDLTALDPELGSDRMNRDGRGIWAGSIRYHQGRFWVYFGTPDGGIYMATALRPEAAWSTPKPVIAAAGWDDPCPFWDDDGTGYLVATRFDADRDGQKYRIHLFAMNAGNDAILEGSDRILHQSRGSEANKLYKVDGVYLHYFSEVRPEGRVAMMERSRSLQGPWEVRQLNHVHAAVDKEPNQGGLIQLKDGRWWFLTHQGHGDWEGRAGVLLPVTWIDGWPVPGRPGEDGIGEMVWGGAQPLPTRSKPELFVSDSLRGRSLLPQWEWRYQPPTDAWSLTGRSLRLQALAPLAGKDEFAGVRNVVTQRAVRTARAQVTVLVHLDGLVNGQEAGLAHFAKTNCRLAVVRAGRLSKLLRTGQAQETVGPAVTAASIWLRSTWSADGMARFSYSLDGAAFTEIGDACRLSWGAYRGDRIGLYTFNDIEDQGHVDFSDFSYLVER